MKTNNLNPHQLDQYYANQEKRANLIQWIAVLAVVASIVITSIVMAGNFQAY